MSKRRLPSGPLVGAGLVLAGETWVIFAVAKTGWVWSATDEFRLPTTPTTASSPASLVAAFLPTSGLASSSTASTSSVQPGMAFFSLKTFLDGELDGVLDTQTKGGGHRTAAR